MIDLFSGLGGASAAMKDRGWDITRVDIESRFLPDIVADVKLLRPGLLWTGVDLLWASPPCSDFSVIRRLPKRRLNRPPDLSCVDAVLRLIWIVRPKWWILENAAGLEEYLGPARQRFRWHYLWGNFPFVLSDTRSDKGVKWRIGEDGYYGGKGISKEDERALRAKIPYGLSLAIALSVEAALPARQGDATVLEMER